MPVTQELVSSDQAAKLFLVANEIEDVDFLPFIDERPFWKN
jgi:hypothetical protein